MAKKEQLNKQPFIEHIHELRQRLFIWALTALAGGGVGYWLNGSIQDLLIKPLNQPLFYTSPTGGFDFLLKICIFFGILVSIPVFTYHALKFIEPLLARNTRFLIVKLLVSSTVLAAVGVSFAYFISLPAALHFLMDFGSDNIKSLISTNEYMNFVMVYLAGYALLFQLPLVLLFINRVKPMRPKKLMGAQRFVVLGSFVVSAMLTPTPDPVNQGIMAGPMIALYELSIVMIWIANHRHRKAAKRAAKRSQAEWTLDDLETSAPVLTAPAATAVQQPAYIDMKAGQAKPVSPLASSQLLAAAQPVPLSRHSLKLDPKPYAAPRPQPVASTVPRSVWRSPAVVALAEKPVKAQLPASRFGSTRAPGRPAPVDLSSMKYDPFYRPSRNIIDMRPKQLPGEAA